MAGQNEIAPRLYQNIADKIAKSIESGDFGVGARLPAERELAEQYGVSRPTVREALVALEIAGMVEVRTGSGTYVCPKSRKNTSKKTKRVEDAGPSAFELISARRMIEPSIAAHAASCATKKDIISISNAMTKFEENWHGTHWEKLEADRAFHMSIAEATHNAFMVKFLEELWIGMFGPIFAVLSERSKLTSRQAMTMGDHYTIFNSIKRGDSNGAHAAMTTHLVHVELTLLEQQSTVLANPQPLL